MRSVHAVAVSVCFALACSGSSSSPKAQPPTGTEPSTHLHSDAGLRETSSDARAKTEPLTQRDCAELIAHIVDLAVKEDAKEHPDLPPPTDEELAAMHAQLRDELAARCVGSKRGIYDCAMRAETRDELIACEDSPS